MKRMFALLIFVAIAASHANAAGLGERKRIIGVFYDGCELLCRGFLAGIEESGFPADVDVLNIEQDKSRLPAIVAMARETRPDLVLTYGTSTTLGIIGTLADVGDPRFLSDIPVVFTIVADPFGSGIARDFEGSGRDNVAGTFNRVPELVNIEVIRQYDPAVKKLGLLYNSDERNSVLKRDELQKIAPELGIELIAIEVDPEHPDNPDPAMIPIRLAELRARGVEWLYMGSSSFLRFNGEMFTSAAVENGIGVVSPYEEVVRDNHALLSIAARPEDIGRLAAEQALQILRDGAKPGDLPILRATDFAYVVNMAVATRLNRFPPFAFLQVAEVVNK